MGYWWECSASAIVPATVASDIMGQKDKIITFSEILINMQISFGSLQNTDIYCKMLSLSWHWMDVIHGSEWVKYIGFVGIYIYLLREQR